MSCYRNTINNAEHGEGDSFLGDVEDVLEGADEESHCCGVAFQ